MAYVNVNGLRTWHEVQGAGHPLVLLHGAFAGASSWSAQAPVLARAGYKVHAPERRGHAHTPDLEGPLTYQVMADDTAAYFDGVVGGPAHLVGWSDGGIVGLLVAISRPDLVRKLVVIGANFDTSGLTPEAMEWFATISADSDDLAMLRESYLAASPDGPGHWPVMVAKFKEMVITQPAITVEQLARITAATLIVVGDGDIVTLDHTSTLFRAIPNSELAVLPGASHLLTMEKPDLVNRLVLDFLEKDPVPGR